MPLTPCLRRGKSLTLSRGERGFFVRIFVLIGIYDTDGCLDCQGGMSVSFSAQTRQSIHERDHD